MKRPGRKNSFAVIFDMDGVVIDNTQYHILTWQKFAQEWGYKLSKKFIREKFMGRLARDIMKNFFKIAKTQKELEKIDAQRETYYRKIYAKHIKPVKGLLSFLKNLKNKKFKVALATSAPPTNVKFTLSKTGLTKYFKVAIDAKGVKHGKPAPDIFLKAAKKLKVKPSFCVVFEDTFHGIKAAKGAGMKVVAVATSHKAKEIGHADLVIKDFNNFSVSKLADLYEI